jgi:hypothetical protein
MYIYLWQQQFLVRRKEYQRIQSVPAVTATAFGSGSDDHDDADDCCPMGWAIPPKAAISKAGRRSVANVHVEDRITIKVLPTFCGTESLSVPQITPRDEHSITPCKNKYENIKHVKNNFKYEHTNVRGWWWWCQTGLDGVKAREGGLLSTGNPNRRCP